jgi:acyl-CoA thioester hydrolase
LGDQVTRTKPHRGKLLHELQMPVRWGDMDALGHVNNTVFLRYFEQSRIEWAESLGRTLDQKGESMILLKSTVTYLKPLVYPADLIVRLYAGAVGGSSFTLYNDLFVKGAEAAAAAEGEFIIVWLDYRSGKSARVPQALRALLEGAPA